MKVALLCYILDVRLDLSFRAGSKQPHIALVTNSTTRKTP